MSLAHCFVTVVVNIQYWNHPETHKNKSYRYRKFCVTDLRYLRSLFYFNHNVINFVLNPNLINANAVMDIKGYVPVSIASCSKALDILSFALNIWSTLYCCFPMSGHVIDMVKKYTWHFSVGRHVDVFTASINCRCIERYFFPNIKDVFIQVYLQRENFFAQNHFVR